MTIAVLYKNPLGHLTQWGAFMDRVFIYDPSDAVDRVSRVKPDWLFVNKGFDEGVVEALVKQGFPLCYFYGDYRHSLGRAFYWHASVASVVLTTWFREDISSTVVRQGIDPLMWYPIYESPEVYDVGFCGNWGGGSLRIRVLEALSRDFKLLVIGSGWSSRLPNATCVGHKDPPSANKYLSLCRTTVGAFNFEDLSNLRYYTSNRLYQCMATGKVYVGPFTKDLHKYFSPRDAYMDYSGYADLKTKLKYLLGLPKKKRLELGRAQHDWVMRDNTIRHACRRIEEVLRNAL